MDLQKAINGMSKEKRIEIPTFNKFSLLNIIDINYELLLNINDLRDIKTISSKDGYIKRFDTDGKLLKRYNDYGKGNVFEEATKYVDENGLVKKQIKFCTMKCDESLKLEEDKEYFEYQYNDIGDVIGITYYKKDIQTPKYIKKLSIEIEYKTDGSLLITKKEYLILPSSDEEIIYCQDIRLYDNFGRILERKTKTRKEIFQHVSYGVTFCEYEYNSCGNLIGIRHSDNSYDKIIIIADDMIIMHKDRESDSGFMKEKRHFNNGKLVSIKWYSAKNSLQVSNEKKYEYY